MEADRPLTGIRLDPPIEPEGLNHVDCESLQLAEPVAARDPSVAALVAIDLRLVGRLLENSLVPFLRSRSLGAEYAVANLQHDPFVSYNSCKSDQKWPKIVPKKRK